MTSSDWSRRAATAAITLAVLSTVVFLPAAFYRWVLPKELVLAVACVIALFAVASGRLPRWLWVSGGIAVVILFVAALSGAAPLPQLFGRWPRYEGLVTIPVYIAAGWMGARLLGPTAGAASYRAFHSAAAVAAILLGAVALLESVGLRPISSNLARPGSLLGNATDQGIVGVMLAAVLLFGAVNVAASRLRRAFLAAGLAFAVTATVLSASRAAILALGVVAVAAVVVAVVRAPRAVRFRRAAASLGVVLCLGVLTLLVPLTRSRLLGTSPSAGQSTTARLTIWDAAVRLVADSPLVGSGPSGFLDGTTQLQSAAWARDIGSGVTIDSPHNWLLQAAVAGGVPLLLCAITVAVLVLFTGLKAWRGEASATRSPFLLGALLALTGYGLALLTHFTTPGTTILAGLLVGGLVAGEPAAQLRVGVRRLRVALLSVWVVLLALATAAEVPLDAGVRAAANGDVAAATAAFTTAQALRPWDADLSSIAAQSLASAAERQAPGAAAEVVLWARRSLGVIPDAVATSKALAVGLQFSGDLESAKQVLSELNERSPSDAQVLHRLGGIEFLLGETSDAIRDLEQASQLDPDNADIWVTLGYVYAQTGDSAGAARAEQRLAELLP